MSTIEETVPLPLPIYTQAVLLPFGHHIIYDSLLTSYNVMFGPGIRFADIESYVKGKPGKQPLTSFKRFVRFLISTGRIDYETGENLYDLLKRVSKGK